MVELALSVSPLFLAVVCVVRAVLCRGLLCRWCSSVFMCVCMAYTVGVCLISAGNSENRAAPQVTSRDYMNILPSQSLRLHALSTCL